MEYTLRDRKLIKQIENKYYQDIIQNHNVEMFNELCSIFEFEQGNDRETSEFLAYKEMVKVYGLKL